MTQALPSIESTGGRAFWIEGFDGARLRGAAWEAPGAEPAGSVLLLNGRTEFIEKNLEAVGELRRRGFAVFTLDWRGQGLSARPLDNPHKGHVESFQEFLDDLAIFHEQHVLPGLKTPLLMVAHSMGGHNGLRFLHDRGNDFSGALFSSPMVDIAATGLKAAGRSVLGWLGGIPWLDRRYLPGGGDYGPGDKVFEGNPLTSDRERFELIHAQIARNPKLALGSATLGWLHAARESIAILNEPSYAQAIRTPLVIASAGEERIVDNGAQADLAELLPNGRLVTIPGARHELMIEAEVHRGAFWAAFDRLRSDIAG